MSDISICFVANFHKTELFDLWAKSLQVEKKNIFWITTNQKIYNNLAKDYLINNILLVNWETFDKFEYLGEFNLNELVYGDRLLRYQKKKGLKWLRSIQKPLIDFISTANIKFIIGELTWAHEILIMRIVKYLKDLNCVYLNPHTVRIPNSRFAFFLDEFQTELYENQLEAPSKEFLEKEFTIKKPDYFNLNNEIIKKSRTAFSKIKRLRRFFTRENIDKYDPTLPNNPILQFKLRALEEFNREAYYFIQKTPWEAIKDKKYALLALHKQPEASIDVLGRYAEDQLQNIRNIWRILPENCLLVIKEHTNAIGDRSLSFYREINKLPRVVLIDEKIDSYILIRNADYIFSVSGTIAYEAALLDKKAFTLCRTFFNKLKYCSYINSFNNADYYLKLQASCGNMDKQEFYSWLWARSFPGIISDPISNIDCSSEQNITLLARALTAVINDYVN